MNNSTVGAVVFGLAVALASLPIQAQTTSSAAEKSDDTFATVKSENGDIMISDNGGEFATAAQDQRVTDKARLMVAENSKATVKYDNGCDKTYDEPGVYDLSTACVAALLGSGAGTLTDWIIPGVVIGAVAVYSIHEANSDNDRRPPVSR